MGNKKAVLYYKYRSQQKSRTAKMLTVSAPKKSANQLYDQNADRHAPKKSAKELYSPNADRYARKKSANQLYDQNADRYAPKKSAKEPYDQNADRHVRKSQQKSRTAKMLTVMCGKVSKPAVRPKC